MSDHDITLLDHGGNIEIDIETMVDGMFEMFDDLCDFALSRVYARTGELDGGFDFDAIDQTEIDRFKLAWHISLGELMFHGMADQPMLKEIKNYFYAELERSAGERRAKPFFEATRASVPDLIRDDKNFVENGLFNRPTGNREDDNPRNQGLGPQLAGIIANAAFDGNEKFAPISEQVRAVIELEFNNAYGHASIACAAFDIV